MLVTRLSPITKIKHTLEVPVTEEQIADWKCGTLIQHAMPNVPQELREFLMTGVTPDEWKYIFGTAEDRL